MGFKTFGDTGYVDESYDAEENPHKRYKMVMNEIKNLSNLTSEQKNTFLYNCKDIIEHNYNHLKNFDMDNYNKNLLWHFQKQRTNLDQGIKNTIKFDDKRLNRIGFEKLIIELYLMVLLSK